ncbi:hypothetical protein A2U01_0106920, partial [Trifolium medium]|nr:hypothetical protein [Trifolium medium]
CSELAASLSGRDVLDVFAVARLSEM